MPIFNETYKSAAVSSANISYQDSLELKKMVENGHSMLGQRPTGFFFKLYDDVELNKYQNLSPALNELLTSASEQGYRLIEVDESAEMAEEAQEFVW